MNEQKNATNELRNVREAITLSRNPAEIHRLSVREKALQEQLVAMQPPDRHARLPQSVERAAKRILGLLNPQRATPLATIRAALTPEFSAREQEQAIEVAVESRRAFRMWGAGLVLVPRPARVVRA
jgi:hypothetical protein